MFSVSLVVWLMVGYYCTIVYFIGNFSSVAFNHMRAILEH